MPYRETARSTKSEVSIKQQFADIKQTLKLKLFNMVFEMHSIVHLNPKLAAFMLAIDFLANIVLIVYLRIVSLPNTDSLFISSLSLEYFANEILFINEVNYVLNMFFVGGIFYFFLILLLTNPDKPRRKGQAWKLNIMIIVLYSIHTCFSTFIIGAQTVNIFCNKSVENFTCLDGSNVDSAIVSSLGICACLLNSYFIDNIYNFHFMGINGETGILSNQKTFTLLGPITKYFCFSIYFSGLPDSVTSIMFVCASLVYFVQLYMRFRQSYNFSKLLSEVEVTGMSLCVYNYALCVFVNVLSFDLTNGDFFIAFSANFILAYFIYILKKSSWNDKLNHNFLTMKNIAAKEMYAYRMLECITKFSFQDQLVLSGLLKTHRQQCNNKKCICRFDKMMKDLKDETHKSLILDFNLKKAGLDSKALLRQKTQRNFAAAGQSLEYQGSLTKLKSNQQLLYLNILLKWLDISYTDQNQHRMRIIQAYVLTDILDKDLKSLFLLSTVTNLKLNIQEQFAIFCYQKIIFQKINSRIKNLTPQSLDITQIQKSILTETKLTRLYKEIEITVSNCMEFWKIIENKDRDLDFPKMHELSMNISKNSLKVDRVYRDIRQLQPAFFNIIVIYYKFLKHVLNYESDSQREQNELSLAIQKRRIQNSKILEFQNELQDLNRKIGLVVLKVSKRSVGRIAQVNNEIANLTQMKIEKLINSNISVLFPHVIDETSHNKCLEQFFTEKTSSSFINQKKTLWLKDQNGFVIVVDFYVQPFYDQILGLQLIAYLKQTESMSIKDHDIQIKEVFTILTDYNGKIQCGSQNLSDFLKFNNSQDLRNSDINIYELCLQAQDFIANGQIEEGVTTDLVLSELNLEVNQDRRRLSSFQNQQKNKQLISQASSISDDDKKNLDELIIQEEELGQPSRDGFGYFKQITAKIRVKADLQYLGGTHKYFNFGVFYMSFIKKEKILIQRMNDLESQSEELDHIKNQIDLEGSITASSASSSNSRNYKQINNLKSEYEILKAPRIIGIFQKIFMVYFAIFLGLSVGIMFVSYNYMNGVRDDIDQYYTSKQTFDHIVELRKNVRELILIANNQTSMSSQIVKSRQQFIFYSIDSKIQILKALTNKINDYILQNVDDPDHYYSHSLQNDQIQLKTLSSSGQLQQVKYSFIPGLSQLISQVQIVLASQNKTCNCMFRAEDFSKNYQFSDFEREFYFVDQNSVDIIGRLLFQKLDDLSDIVTEDSDEIVLQLIYLSVPGVFISLFCSVLFFPVLLKMTNNRKNVIEMLARIKIRTSQIAQKKLDKFMFDLVQNKNKKREMQNYYDDYEYEQLQQDQNQDGNQNSALSSTVQFNATVKLDNFQDQKYSTQDLIVDQGSLVIFEQSLTEKQLVNTKMKKNSLILEQKRKALDAQQAKINSLKLQIDKQFSKQKCTNIAKILSLSVIYSFFFVTIYFMNTMAAQDAAETIKTIRELEDRASCLSAIPLYVRQRLITNQTVDVGYTDEPSIDYLFNFCLQNANQVQELRKNPPKCLNGQEFLLENYESDQLCLRSEALISSDSSLRSNVIQSCASASNGAFNSGIQHSYNYLLAEFRKYQISFEGIQPTSANIQRALRDDTFVLLQDSITLYLKPTIVELNSEIYSEIRDYFSMIFKRSIIIFVAFVVLLFLFIVLIIVYLLKIIQKELYFNKKVIKFIPIDELQRKSMINLLKTLNF